MNRKALPVLVVSCMFAAGTAMVLCAGPTSIAYHRYAMGHALKEAQEVGPGHSGQSALIREYEEHRHALVALGYLERKEYVLTTIDIPSLESKRLWEELQVAFSNYEHVEMQAGTCEHASTITVWDRPQRLALWGEIIGAHDAPPSNIFRTDDEDAAPELGQYVGDWLDGDGDICYSIASVGDGSLTIVAPPDDNVRVVFKNCVVKRGEVGFDQFFYIELRQGPASVVDRHGDHAFSGVRCKSTLAAIPGDPTHIEYVMSTIHLAQPEKAMLTRGKTR